MVHWRLSLEFLLTLIFPHLNLRVLRPSTVTCLVINSSILVTPTSGSSSVTTV